MADPKPLFRKTPRERLREYLSFHSNDLCSNIDWDAKDRAFVAAVESAINSSPSETRDPIFAELDQIAQLAGDSNALDAIRACAPTFALASMEGAQDAAFGLFADDRRAFEAAVVNAQFRSFFGGRSMAAFLVPDDAVPRNLDSAENRESFERKIVELLELQQDARHETDWFEICLTRQDEDAAGSALQVTFYVEQPAEADLRFDDENSLKRMTRRPIKEAIIVYDQDAKTIEVAAPKQSRLLEKFAEAFAASMIGETTEIRRVELREIDFGCLVGTSDYELSVEDKVDRVEVSALKFAAGAGTVEVSYLAKHGMPDINSFMTQKFGQRSPAEGGWSIVSATLRIHREPRKGKRAKVVTVDLRAPNKTSLRSKADEDRKLVTELFERWGIYVPREDEPLFETD